MAYLAELGMAFVAPRRIPENDADPKVRERAAMWGAR